MKQVTIMIKHSLTNTILFLPIVFSLTSCGDLTDAEMSMESNVETNGYQLFHEHCSHCHGQQATGGFAKPLSNEHIAQMSESQLFMSIYNGLSDQMPSFRSTLSSDEIVSIIDYLRTLNSNQD